MVWLPVPSTTPRYTKKPAGSRIPPWLMSTGPRLGAMKICPFFAPGVKKVVPPLTNVLYIFPSSSFPPVLEMRSRPVE